MEILDLGRNEAKPRKDFVCARQMWDFISYFYDDYFVIEERIPEQVSDEDAVEILKRYLKPTTTATTSHGGSRKSGKSQAIWDMR